MAPFRGQISSAVRRTRSRLPATTRGCVVREDGRVPTRCCGMSCPTEAGRVDAECEPAEDAPPLPHEVEVKVTRNWQSTRSGPVAMEMVVHTPFAVDDDGGDDFKGGGAAMANAWTSRSCVSSAANWRKPEASREANKRFGASALRQSTPGASQRQLQVASSRAKTLERRKDDGARR